MPISVAIDGYSGSGKSTLAKTLACKLGYLYLDTGAMYRAVTVKILETVGLRYTQKQLKQIIASTQITISKDDAGAYRFFLDGRDVSDRIREPEISAAVSSVAAEPLVRLFLVKQQRAIARGKHVVLEGRDIGTVVLPDARFKFFVTADMRERARRRRAELQEKNIDISVDDVLANLTERDKIDSSRKMSPLKKADDAIEIDTTHLSRSDAVDYVYKIIKRRLWEKSFLVYYLYRFILLVIAKLFFRFSVHFENRDALKEFSGIIISNHCSNFDPPAIGVSLPFPIHYFAKKELFRTPLMRAILKSCLTIPVDRTNPSLESIKNTLEVLREGHPLLIFPEGTRSPDGTLQKPRQGSGMIAYKAGVPILPVYVDGTFNVLPRGATFPRLKKYRIYVGTPYKIDYDSIGKVSKKDAYMTVSQQMITKIELLKNNPPS